MRRAGWLLWAALGTIGCVELPYLEGKKDEQVVAPRQAAPAPPPLVSPERITAANAREQAEALRRELVWDEQQAATAGRTGPEIEP